MKRHKKPYHCPPDYVVPDKYANRLLSKADIIEFQGSAKNLKELKEEVVS